MLRFIPEGFREIGRKANRFGLRRRIGALERERRAALALVGRSAWQAGIDLSAFADLRGRIEQLHARAGDLSATTARLNAERADFQSRRQTEAARFDERLRPAQAKQAQAEAALRAARAALAKQDHAIREAESRHEPADAARAAREPLAANVARLTIDAQCAAEEVATIQADRKAALLPIDTELTRVQDESGRTTKETAGVVREQDEQFTALGAALYERQDADPSLAESVQKVASVDGQRAATRANLDASLALTGAMRRGAMAAFWAVFVIVPILAIGVAYFVAIRVARSIPPNTDAVTDVSDRGTALASVAADEARKDATVRSFLESPGDQATRKDAVGILAADLAELGSSADRSHLPTLVRILKGGEPELRAAATQAIGMIGPSSAEAPLLVDALNDPAPAVRDAAVRALREVHDAPALRLLVRRVQASATERGRGRASRFEAEAAADAGRLKASVYPGAVFLHYASDLEAGRAAFSSPDPVQKVLDFYAAAAGRPALGGDEFSRVYFGGSSTDPTGMKRLAAETEAWFRQAAESKRPMAEIEAEADRRAARMTNLPLVRYADAELYGTPRFVALEEAPTDGGKRAVRFVVVFEDRALGLTGFEIHVRPDARRP